MEELKTRAKQGDAKAMQAVALNYLKGRDGFRQDYVRAFGWFDTARIHGDISGLAHAGWLLALGKGVPKDSKRGLIYMALAAERGSDVAAYWLGRAFAEGRYGLSVDLKEARHWLERSLSDDCHAKNLSEAARLHAQQKLLQIKSTLG